MRNEICCHTKAEVRHGLLHLRDVMVESERRSIGRDGLLPGSLQVRRRAKTWYERLSAEDPTRKPEFGGDWVNLVALAVNEENASGGRIVTVPTNGAAGIVRAVLHYATHYTPAGAAEPGDPDEIAVRFLLTPGAIGSLFKERASISGAEVGCQGEVGSAAAMAAAGLAEILGGTTRQVENAAEIAMEHGLGLTCDPIAGAGADPLHRTQRDFRRQGHQRRADGAARGRLPPPHARPDLRRRPGHQRGRQHCRMLTDSALI
jgi:L-serine dehydratase